jgi:hypothetical protein
VASTLRTRQDPPASCDVARSAAQYGPYRRRGGGVRIRSTLSLLCLVLGSLAPTAAAGAANGAAEPIDVSRDFGRFSLGLGGGFQLWTLTALEGTLDTRADQLALDGFAFGEARFDLTFSYGVEIQSRLTQNWFARAQFEWSQLAWSDRNQTYISQLGSTQRTPVSIAYETKVRTDPVFFAFGAGRAFVGRTVRFAFSANAVVAPLRVEDVLEVHMESGTTSEVTSTGTGFGLEADFSVDYFTEVRTTLYAELFIRAGSTTVELEERYWESTILPQQRRVDFDGAGIRLGLRWF